MRAFGAGLFTELENEIDTWALDAPDHEELRLALTELRSTNRIPAIEAAAYASGYKENPNSKIAENFISLLEDSGSRLIAESTATYPEGTVLGWVGYSEEDRERMLARRPGSDTDADWNAFYFATTSAQAEGYGENLARVVTAAPLQARILRANDLFFAANLPQEHKASRLKAELGIDPSQTLMPGLGNRPMLHIVIGLEGLDSEHELEHIVAWAHAERFLALKEVPRGRASW